MPDVRCYYKATYPPLRVLLLRKKVSERFAWLDNEERKLLSICFKTIRILNDMQKYAM